MIKQMKESDMALRIMAGGLYFPLTLMANPCFHFNDITGSYQRRWEHINERKSCKLLWKAVFEESLKVLKKCHHLVLTSRHLIIYWWQDRHFHCTLCFL